MLRMTMSQLQKVFGKDKCHELGVKKEPKYRNQKCSWGGKNFDSEHERDRYMILLDDQRQGKISQLRTQVRFELIPAKRVNGKVVERACWYVADFVYMKGEEMVVEDAKSEITRKNPTYIIKRKLMLEKYGIMIQEV